MNKYQNMAFELKKVFNGTLLQTICEVFPLLMFLPLWGSSLIIIIAYVCFFGRILFPVICMRALYEVGKDISVCKKAAALCLTDIAVYVLRYIVEADSINDTTYILFYAISGTQGWKQFGRTWTGIKLWVDKIGDLVHCVALFLMVYYVCTSVAAVLKKLDADKIAKSAQTVWKLQLVASIFYMIVTLSSSLWLAYRGRIIDLVATVFYLRFLHRSYRAFGAYTV